MKTRSFGNAMLYSFQNKNGMIMEVSDFGATLHALIVPDKYGKPCDIVLGFDSPEEYMGSSDTAFGATIGRNSNRINKATFVLNGETYHLDKNNGENNLHSGYDYYHYRMWDVKETTKNSITFILYSPDGDQGYPGTLQMEVTYSLTNDNELRIDYYGVPEEDTIINMTNHSYFNLNGHASGNVLEQEVWLNADTFLPTDEHLIPTGKIVSVEGTPMDFRKKRAIGERINDNYESLIYGEGYDHNWCLNNKGIFEKVAELSSNVSGITMEVYTDLPGVQIYTANSLDKECGKEGAVYDKYQGICFETQYYPDAIHHENFPSSIYKKGQEYRTTTVYKFV